jgi:hypothetical protein
MPTARHIAPAMPLLRLIGVNCIAGLTIALFTVAGLLVLNDQLRSLILADQSPGVALALLSGGFAVTFASAVMGTAIMALGRD